MTNKQHKALGMRHLGKDRVKVVYNGEAGLRYLPDH